MNQRSPNAGTAGASGLTLAFLCLLGTNHANAGTYFKCVDAKGAVTVQQTACATNSAQEEKKVWGQGTQAASPTASSGNEKSSSAPRRADEAARSKER